ncbi:MAG: PDZ domain-containing protein, partial [Fuerstia sp.]|nr:PDZ domain-containing protein [Fuerstiella sp.]
QVKREDRRPAEAAESGVEVTNVQPGSSASSAGIKPSDVLLKFEGKPLKDFDELIELLKTYRPDDEVTFKVRRYSVREPFDVKVKLQGWYER